MGKFKVGDKVSVNAVNGWVNGIVLGEYKSCNGLYLTKVPDGNGWSVNKDEASYYVEECGTIVETGRRCYWNARKFEIEPLKLTKDYAKRPKRRIVIEITDDGAEAKYIVGKNIEKTASVKRYIEDMPDDRLAAYYVVGKLFGMFGKDISFSVPTIDVEELKRATANVEIAFDHIEKAKKILREQAYSKIK